MSKITFELTRAIFTGVTTAISAAAIGGGTVLMFNKTVLSSVPAPTITERALGGVREMICGASSIPYLTEGGVLLLGATATAILWKNRKVRACVEDSVLGLKERMGFKLQEKPSPRINHIISESIRTDSSENDAIAPKVQVKVGSIKDGVFVVYGSAVRICDAVVVPAHVITSASDADGNVWFKGSQGSLKIHVDGFNCIETDLYARSLGPEEFSRIGMPQVKLAECLPPTGEFISIVGVQSKGTVGKLVHDNSVFGKVVYSGTTMPGYSGAPYMKGNAVVGIHCWGGKVNGGYSASYVKVLIQRMLKQVCEASEDWLADKFARNSIKKTDIRFEPGNDEAWIRYNGQYHIVSGDVFRKARGFDYLGYDDSDSMRVEEALMNSGESKSLKNPGASGDVTQSGDIEQLVTNSLTKMLEKFTHKQLRDLKNSVALSKAEPNTNGLLSEPKRN